MSTRLKCPQGHEWLAGDNNAAPLVCPTCGRAPAGGAVAVAEQPLDDERTIDLSTPTPVPAAALREDMTVDFTPTPAPRGASPAPSPQTTSLDNRKPGGGVGGKIENTGMPFVIVRQHAKGGLGVVSLARDDQIKREVALKQILPQHVDNPILNRRFLYEAQITGQLEHPSIVPVYTLGSDAANHPYYVMRFIKGRTLDQIIIEHHAGPNPIVFRELLRRFIAICQAVAYAHSRGVIHRDLKPSNIMLGDYGETLVLDWGLAKDIKNPNSDPALWTGPTGPSDHGRSAPRRTETTQPAQTTQAPDGNPGLSHSQAGMTRANNMAPATNSAELTMEGQIIGTPAYMAPEQAEGRTELHAPTTDIYALGGILYKILTGQSPQAPTASTTGANGTRKLTFMPSPPPAEISKGVPDQLNLICQRAMATEPASRFPRALELAQEIQRWLDEHPLTTRPRTATGRLAAQLRSHALLLITILAMATAAFATLWLLKLGK